MFAVTLRKLVDKCNLEAMVREVWMIVHNLLMLVVEIPPMLIDDLFGKINCS
jgi:hypothetical protein